MRNYLKGLVASSFVLLGTAQAAFDPAATVTELGTAETSVLAIFAAMVPVIISMFVISKVRQLGKA